VNHMKDLTSDDLTALATFDPETPEGRTEFNRLAHEMMRRDGDVPIEEAIKHVNAGLMDESEALDMVRRGAPEYDGTATRYVYEVRHYRRPIADLCRPGAFDPEPIVKAVREWTGRHLTLAVEYDGSVWSAMFHTGLTGDPCVCEESPFMAHAVIVAAVVACVVYGRDYAAVTP